MPAPSQYQNRQKQFTDFHAELYYKMDIAQRACYQALDQYNPLGSGSMPDVELRIPNSYNIIKYRSGTGEIQLNGTDYSSLNATDKKIVFKYLDALTKECLLQYDILYNL
jgi:hypothetical protein